MRLLIVLILAIASLHTVHSQRRDRSISLDFNSWPGALRPMPDGKWLAVARSEAAPEKEYTDGIFALIFNTEGDVLLRKRLDLPKAEVNRIRDVVVTADGGFVISVKQELCDAGIGLHILQKISAAGEVLWNRVNTPLGRLPMILELGPDGHIWGTDGFSTWYKINQATGETIWEKPFKQFGGGGTWVSDFALIPGTDNIVALGSPDIQRWEPGFFEPDSYELSQKRQLQQVSVDKMVQSPDGNAYTFDGFDGHKLYRFPLATLNANLIQTYLFKIKDISTSPTGLVMLAERDGQPLVVRTNWNGAIQDSIAFFKNEWLTGQVLATNSNNIAVLGLAGSGPVSNVEAWERYNAHGLWLHTIGGGVPPLNFANAAVTMVHQLTALDTLSASNSFSPTGRIYTISGGQFQVQVANTGTELLNEVDVLTSFNWSEAGICYFRSAHRRHYTDLNLAPGASMLLDFGDVFGERQHEVLTELCFWTASPNEKPDTDHSDDVFCLAPTIHAFEPPDKSIVISPNPVSDALLIVNQTQHFDYQFYDIAGQQVEVGRLSEGQNRNLLPVGHLQPGLYWLRIGTWVGKVVVAPR